MNKLQLTKGELTKIILEEVRSLQEQNQDLDAVSAKAAAEELQRRVTEDPNLPAKLLAILKEMDNYE